MALCRMNIPCSFIHESTSACMINIMYIIYSIDVSVEKIDYYMKFLADPPSWHIQNGLTMSITFTHFQTERTKRDIKEHLYTSSWLIHIILHAVIAELGFLILLGCNTISFPLMGNIVVVNHHKRQVLVLVAEPPCLTCFWTKTWYSF